MSLVDTEDGTVWARPADVACTECGLVFFDALARDQHFKASHQLLHCQGCVHQLSFLILYMFPRQVTCHALRLSNTIDDYSE